MLKLTAALLALALLGQVFILPTLADVPDALATSGIATDVSDDLRPITIKFEGVISACPLPLPSTWRIADLYVAVSPKTVIIPPGRIAAPGDYAIVTAVRAETPDDSPTPDGEATLTATRIALCPEGDTGARTVEFRGVIGAFPQTASYRGVWTIGHISVALPDRAQLVGVPTLGYYARVVGWLKRDRQVEAVSITIVNPIDELARFEFQGSVQAPFEANSWLLTISGITGLVTDQTTIEGEMQVGAVVDVRGRRLPGGQVWFEQVRVLPEADRAVRLRGPIQAIDATLGVWDIGGISVALDDLTYVDQVRGPATPGMWAEVLAIQQGEGLYALRIRVERAGN
jgi:hypothetical protein